jgi:hypothetical protein
MRRTFTKYFSLIPILMATCCVACAPMTEAQLEEREYARVEWREQFRSDRSACQALGRIIVVDGSAELDRDDVPKTRVFYTCA